MRFAKNCFLGVVFVVNFLSWGYSVSVSLTPEQVRQIDEAIEGSFMPINSIPGVGLSIVSLSSGSEDNGVETFAKGYGLRDVANFWPANNDTLFGIASITKSFTSTIVVKVLHEKFPELGEAALEYPIAKLLPPSYNFTLSDRYRFETMSFRDLLAHRTCLSSFILGRTVGSISTASEFAYRTRFVKEVCRFRTSYTYNNLMYSLAGDLIGEIAGSTFIQLAEGLLQQLGMTDTVLLKSTLNFDEMPNASRGYYRNNNVLVQMNSDLFKRMHVALPSGGLMASSRDIAKYMAFQLNYGKLGENQIVPEDVMKRLTMAAYPFNLYDSKDGNVGGDYAYGLGLNIGIYNKWKLVSHEGSWPPFTSRMSLFPDLNIGIFTAVNGPGGLQMGHKTIHDRIIQIVTGVNLPIATAQRDVISSGANVHSGQQDSHLSSGSGLKSLHPTYKLPSNWKMEKLQDIAGMYGNPIHGEFTVIYNASDAQGSLYLQYGLWGTGYLEPMGGGNLNNTTFNLNWDSDVIGDFLSHSTQLPTTTLDFSSANIAILQFGWDTAEFYRNATLDQFPSQGWSPGSCGPEE